MKPGTSLSDAQRPLLDWLRDHGYIRSVNIAEHDQHVTLSFFIRRLAKPEVEDLHQLLADYWTAFGEHLQGR